MKDSKDLRVIVDEDDGETYVMMDFATFSSLYIQTDEASTKDDAKSENKEVAHWLITLAIEFTLEWIFGFSPVYLIIAIFIGLYLYII